MGRLKARLSKERTTASVEVRQRGVKMHLFVWSAAMLEKQKLPKEALVCMALSPREAA
jgi:hypothetical protein